MVGGQRKETGKGDEDGMQRGAKKKTRQSPLFPIGPAPSSQAKGNEGNRPLLSQIQQSIYNTGEKKEGLFLSRLPETDTASPFFPYHRRNRLHVPEKASSRPGRDGRRPRWISLPSPRLFSHPPLSASSSLSSSLETGGVAVANARFSPPLLSAAGVAGMMNIGRNRGRSSVFF